MLLPTRRESLTMLGTMGTVGSLGTAVATGMAQNGQAKEAKERIKIGQIGVGHAHASKLSVYRNSPDYDVVGICEPNESLRNSAMKQAAFQGLTWLTRDELLKTDGLRAVLIETEVRDLLANAEVGIDAGLHLHIDKPAGESLPQLRRILATAEQKKRIVQMGYMYRYNPAVVLLRKFLTNGWLGEIFEVHAVMSKVVGPTERKQLAGYRGGLMFELGCHVLDLVIGILGAPREVASFNRHASSLADGLLDNMLAVLSYPKAIATIKSSALEVDGGNRRHLVVCGTEGTFHIQPLDNPTARITLSRDRGEYKKGTQDVAFPKYIRYRDDAADMARAIRGESTFSFTPQHDLAVQETLLRACGLPLDR